MLTFIFGGAGGIVNGSWELNNIVHNTTWVPGHFHITVGTASALTFMGVAFWMLPHLTGQRLLSRRLALASAWLWFTGMSVFALGMHWAGLHGVPRRAWVSMLPRSVYDRVYGDAHLALILVAVGGCILCSPRSPFTRCFSAASPRAASTDAPRSRSRKPSAAVKATPWTAARRSASSRIRRSQNWPARSSTSG